MRGFFMNKKSAEPKKKKSQPSAHFWKASCVRKQGSVNTAFLSSHTSRMDEEAGQAPECGWGQTENSV